MKVEKPWGFYETLYIEAGFQVKRIQVNPGQRLSYQKHARRSEMWTVVKGEGTVVLNGMELLVREGSVVDIPVSASHRMWNTGPQPLVFVEVQIGDYLGEDDIVRLQDDYKRT